MVVDDAFLEDYSNKATEAFTNGLYFLALSFASALDQAKMIQTLLLTLEQSLEELEFFNAGAAQKILKLTSARLSGESSASAGLVKTNGSLQLPAVPFRLSHVRVCGALLRSLDAAYAKAGAEELDAACFELLVRVDLKAKALVLAPMLKLLQEVAVATIHREMGTLCEV